MDNKIIDSLKSLIAQIEKQEVQLVSFEVMKYIEDDTTRVEITIKNS